MNTQHDNRREAQADLDAQQDSNEALLAEILAEEMFANQHGYSDVNPFEIVRRISDKTIEIRAMSAEIDPTWKMDWVAGGFCGTVVNQYTQRWIITSNPEARVIRIRYGKRGWKDSSGYLYGLSHKPKKFYDYNF